MHGSSKAGTRNITANSQRFLDVALRIGQRLSEDAIWHDGRCTWTGDDVDYVNDEWKVIHQTVDAYLYSGNAGIARFLILCWQASDDDRLRETAMGAIRQSLHFPEQHPGEKLPLGLYDGLTGVALVATDIGHQLQEHEFIEGAQQLTEEICRRIDAGEIPETIDLVSGIAGILTGLVQLAKTTGNPSLYNTCHILSEQLLAQALHTDYGWYWAETAQQDSHAGLCGLGHGAAGIAHALIEYSQMTGDEDCLSAARQAMRYERSWFHPWESNWPDNRDTDEKGEHVSDQELVYPVYWCHGAAGVGLSRLRAYQLTGDKNDLAEAGSAIQVATRHAKQLIKEAKRTRRLSADTNLSVCHGLGSIIDLFVYAHQVLGRDEFLQRARDIGTFCIRISTGKREYWRCGIHDGGETPGLMLGLAGIGYNFLRLQHPTALTPAGMVVDFT